MNMTREKYPKAAAYVKVWRKVKALPDNYGYILETDIRGLGHDAIELKRRFLAALHNRINHRGKLNMRGRRWDGDYQTNLYRDQHALHDRLQRRIIVRQFLTDIVSKRFGHLLTKSEDE